MRLMRTDSPKSVTLTHWDWTFTVFWCDSGGFGEHVFP
jgi:hypothetical protein